MSAAPRFSVVVPTRDRPDLLEFCLESLAAQTSDDFEVVVADNFTTAPARAVFDRWAREGWRYVTPPNPIPMHENFELGCAEAAGEYVAVVIDKTVLHPTAIECTAAALDAADDPATTDIVTWWSEGFDAIDEAHALAPGRYRPSYEARAPERYDARAELEQRFAMAEPRGTDGVHYFRGKIVFGAFSRLLLDRIQETTGRCFFPLAPDYSSMVPALVLARNAHRSRSPAAHLLQLDPIQRSTPGTRPRARPAVHRGSRCRDHRRPARSRASTARCTTSWRTTTSPRPPGARRARFPR